MYQPMNTKKITIFTTIIKFAYMHLPYVQSLNSLILITAIPGVNPGFLERGFISIKVCVCVGGGGRMGLYADFI